MPSSEAILDGLTMTANEWRTLAIAWHVLLAALLLALALSARPRERTVRYLLVAPLVSVGALAWAAGNPFNGTVFAALALGLASVARGVPAGDVRMASRRHLVPGLLLVAFAWVYPHFLEGGGWTAYLTAAPLGLLPCPTLAALIGLTLVLDMRRPTAWSVALAAAGFVYGAIGVFVLGVTLDSGLLGGAAILAAAVARGTSWRSVRAASEERTRRLPGDELIPEPLGTMTHAVTIQRPPSDVWPWLAQMGAGSRAGWYSYDVLDNGRRPSADHVVPEWQRLEVGMIFPALPGATDGFTLLAFERDRLLVLGWRAPDASLLMTWAFVLQAVTPTSTRLIARARASRGYWLQARPWWLPKPMVRVVHFIMERKQLLGIAARVETARADRRGHDRAA